MQLKEHNPFPLYTKKGLHTRQMIFETAVDMFSRRGYSGVSIRDITGAVKIKESSLYHHYRNKEEILTDIYDYFISQIKNTPVIDKKTLAAVPPERGHLMLQKLLIDFKKVMEAPLTAKTWRILTMEQYRDDTAFEIITVHMHKFMIDYYKDFFREMIICKIIKPYDPFLLASEYFYTLIGMFSEYNIQKYYEKNTQRLETLLFEHITFFWTRIKNK
ncbi:MAG: TetR/AcrR family transcriptional regulator [Candidatus Goldiibacteriota bacterium]